MRNHFNTCVLWQGHLYGPDDGGLRCLAFDTGDLKWTYKEFGKGSLMMADGKLVALSEKGELIIAEPSPAAFKPISRAKILTGQMLDHAGVVQRPYLLPQRGRRRGVRGREREIGEQRPEPAPGSPRMSGSSALRSGQDQWMR